jgi:hypothetical protein
MSKQRKWKILIEKQDIEKNTVMWHIFSIYCGASQNSGRFSNVGKCDRHG